MADHASFPPKKKAAMVYLVGAGPGDPGLLTMRAARAISMADVLLYDHLIPLELLDMAPDEAKRIDVGKVRNHPRMSQKEIGETLVEHARQGQSVVRLKGGDPFVFGRGRHPLYCHTGSDLSGGCSCLFGHPRDPQGP